MEIILERIIKEDRKIEYNYSYSDKLRKYIKINKMSVEYPININRLPESILVIPFLCNFLPLVFVTDTTIIVDDIDNEFYQAVNKIKNAYQEMVPKIKMGGRIVYKNISDNKYAAKGKALMFSGGVDAMSSLVTNYKDINELITIWGSDISYSNIDGWNTLKASLSDNLKIINKEWNVIRSNFRDCLNEAELSELVKVCGDGWWHGFQHGIALLGLVAPIAFEHKLETILIASSFTKEFNPICASRPSIDNEFKFSSCSTTHDGFEYDRCEKIKNIYDFIEKHDCEFNLHVCWQDSSGENCCSCEKCYRTYLNCVAVGKNPNKIGLNRKVNPKKVKKFYHTKIEYDKRGIYIINIIKKHFVQNNINIKDYNWIINTDYNKVNNSFYWKFKKIYRKIKRVIRGKKNGRK